MIRAVYFDMGGVLLRSESEVERRKWEKRLGLPEKMLAEIVFENDVAALATVGRATTDAVWAEVGRQLNLAPAALAELRADFFRGDAFDVDLLAFIRALRPRFKTGLISNAWPDAPETTYRVLNATAFDTLLFSAQEGVMKPGAEIYQRALARLGVAPAEAIFVDDVQANIDGARAVGMAGVLFTGSAEVRAEITRLTQPA
jgi:epoxide hydrolase-like predicted phosphatase